MSFTRTNTGISNLPLFYGAEVIVYTEGGNKSFSVQEVEEGKFNTKSVDIKFWSGVFKSYNYSKKVEFRALGSKTASNAICEKIIAGEVANTIVVKDRDLDFDDVRNFDSPYILFTKGYSWENDVFTKFSTIEQIESMLLEQSMPDEILQEIEFSYEQFKNLGGRLLRLELIFRESNKKFITNVSGERFFDPKKSSTINKKAIISFINLKKQEISRPALLAQDTSNLCPILNNYGKLLASLSLNIIYYICKRHSDYKSIPKQLVEMTMIDRFINQQSTTPDEYYSSLISKLDAA
ncbi:hypothetical protein H5185_21065 [Shewanella sp. SG44-6]|uniref:hypothetical protein n=1 Tax=Shewanella sp. SG44-6 TaxID=2760959 RepID=UPI001601A907|nr:hypothetical protein [Shewanella sp. SG44-6]MBB1391877.1 hypothetical protein [Shewanella sp. SG44-6]